MHDLPLCGMWKGEPLSWQPKARAGVKRSGGHAHVDQGRPNAPPRAHAHVATDQDEEGECVQGRTYEVMESRAEDSRARAALTRRHQISAGASPICARHSARRLYTRVRLSARRPARFNERSQALILQQQHPNSQTRRRRGRFGAGSGAGLRAASGDANDSWFRRPGRRWRAAC